MDLRLLNKYSPRTPLDFPHSENQLAHLQNACHFSSFDVISGFDFLPVHGVSQNIFTITIPFGAYKMCGAPMGWCNTPQLFQARIMQELLEPTRLFCRTKRGCLQWIDDSLLYADTYEKLMETMDSFLKQIINKRLRLSVLKCTFYTQEAEFCGRIISGDGWTFKPKFWEAIRNMPRPTKASQLSQAIHVAQWLAVTIPRFSELRDGLDKVMGNHANKPKKVLKQKRHKVQWTDEGIKRLRVGIVLRHFWRYLPDTT